MRLVAGLVLLILCGSALALPVRTVERAAECKWRAVLAARAALMHQQGGSREGFHWEGEDENSENAKAQRAAVDAGWEWKGSPAQIAHKVFAACWGDTEEEI